jgi:hypothetical protein
MGKAVPQHGKTIVKGTRVKSAGAPMSPVAGKSKAVDDLMSATRVKKGPAIARKFDGNKTAADRMGFKIGARVTGGGIKGR